MRHGSFILAAILTFFTLSPTGDALAGTLSISHGQKYVELIFTNFDFSQFATPADGESRIVIFDSAGPLSPWWMASPVDNTFIADTTVTRTGNVPTNIPSGSDGTLSYQSLYGSRVESVSPSIPSGGWGNYTDLTGTIRYDYTDARVDINPTGQLVAYWGYDLNGTPMSGSLVTQAVPEPSAYAMGLLGLVSLALTRLRRLRTGF